MSEIIHCRNENQRQCSDNDYCTKEQRLYHHGDVLALRCRHCLCACVCQWDELVLHLQPQQRSINAFQIKLDLVGIMKRSYLKQDFAIV